MVVVDKHEYLCTEEQRLKDDRERKKYWKKWGPYTAERQWATGESYLSQLDRSIADMLLSPRGLLVRSCCIRCHQDLH